MVAQDGAFDKSRMEFQELLGWMEKAVVKGERVDRVEKELNVRLRTLGRSMLQGHVDAQGTGDLGRTMTYEGRTLRRLEKPRERRLVTIFGDLTINRTVYGTRETQKHEMVPLDVRLGLPDGEFSYLLQDWAQATCVQNAYGKSRELLERILGFGLTVRGLEHMNVQMAEAAESFHATESVPFHTEEGSILVVTADGKGVPMRREPAEGSGREGKRRTKGEKANKKREACVGAVYTIDPFRRTAADVVDEVRRRRRSDDRPVPCHKHVRAELTRVVDGVETNGKTRTFEWLAKEASRRRGSRPLVCLMDGARALWAVQQSHLPDAIGVLDIFHVMERLWTAAHCFHPEGSSEAEAFVDDRLERLLEGDVGRVTGGLKQMMTKHALRGSRRQRLQSVITYFQNNRQYMRYDEYLRAGFPIGSGVAEGACRHLVKDRMELTGMRWRVEGAQAMLELRAMRLNDQWDAFMDYRAKQEQERLYPFRHFVNRAWKKAA